MLHIGFKAYQLGLMATKLSADDWDFGLDRPGGLADRVKEYWNVELVGDAPTKSVSFAFPSWHNDGSVRKEACLFSMNTFLGDFLSAERP